MIDAPYPYFGGKSKVAAEVWRRFGVVDTYVEPFFGSGAVLLAMRQTPPPASIVVNDLDCMIVNFWRALQSDPDAVAYHADWPTTENDLHARHAWLVGQKPNVIAKMEGDPDYCDARIAGWWVWGMANWIGAEWCSGKGPWSVVGGELVRTAGQGINRQLPHVGTAGKGISRQRPHVRNSGQGINRKRPHVRNSGQGINRQLPHVGTAGRGINRQLPHVRNSGQGINRQLPHAAPGRGIKRRLPHVRNSGQGINRQLTGDALDIADDGVFPTRPELYAYLRALADHMRDVRVICGDWERVLTPSVTWAGEDSDRQAACGVFLDPPYTFAAGRDTTIYTHEHGTLAHDVRAWCIANGRSPLMRIALCGYDTEHAELEALGWSVYAWKAGGGYATARGLDTRGAKNRERERIWFSPACLDTRGPSSQSLFDFLELS